MGHLTPEMIAAGADRLWELLEAGVGLSYAAEQVFLVMRELEPPPPTIARPQTDRAKSPCVLGGNSRVRPQSRPSLP